MKTSSEAERRVYGVDQALNLRSDRYSITTLGWFSNKPLLQVEQWGMASALGLLPLPLMELWKWYVRCANPTTLADRYASRKTTTMGVFVLE